MLDKIHKYLLKIKIFRTLDLYYKKIFKQNKKIQEYKKRKQNTENQEQKIRKRNKFNLQLKINFEWHKFKKVIFVILFLLIVLIIILIKWPFFKIKNINIIRLDENVNSRLIEKKLAPIKNTLLFSIEKEEIEKIIKKTQQNIKEVDITKTPPSSINIRLSSYEPIFKTQLKTNKYLITQNWVFLPTKKKNENKTEIKIKDLEIQNYPNYKKILKPENLYKIRYLEEKIKDNIVNLKIESIIYYKTAREIHFIINNKTRVIFDIEIQKEWKLDDKLKQIFVFNKEKVNIIKPWIIYIDNRIKSKILYCTKNKLNLCLETINYIYWEKLKTSDYKQ